MANLKQHTEKYGYLQPCKEESVDWDHTDNLYLEGDNLEMLQLLQDTYREKVKTIYIDPPYNTGNDYVYCDNYHSDWCAMMRPRLEAARPLLQDDGAIFLSIDHHELIHLASLCDEVFGASNRVGIITVVNNLKGRSDETFFATCNEYLLVYAKNKAKLSLNGFQMDEEELDNDYEKEDERGYYKLIGFRKTGTAWRREERPYMYYPVIHKNGTFATIAPRELARLYDAKSNRFDDAYAEQLTRAYTEKGYKVVWPTTESGERGRWRWGIDTFRQRKDSDLDFNTAGTLCTKMRATLEDGSIRAKIAKTLWYKSEYDTGSAAKRLAQLMGGKALFDNPKSLVFIKDILAIGSEKDSTVLDFFSGSATTAHAVMQLNAEDGGTRRFIMIQRPDTTHPNSEAHKAGYANICEIGKERIRRAGKRLLEEEKERKNEANRPPDSEKTGLDVGFRVFKKNNIL
jgi:adenine-specific DNA-methyltransferase